MLKDIFCFYINDLIIKGFSMVINNGFVCVENDEGVFEGIFMRRVVLKQLSSYIRLLNKQVCMISLFVFCMLEKENVYI